MLTYPMSDREHTIIMLQTFGEERKRYDTEESVEYFGLAFTGDGRNEWENLDP